MTPVFADTYYFAALSNLKDRAHGRAVAYASGATCPLVTTSWVITELADGMCKVGTRGTFDKLLGLIRSDAQSTVIAADQSLMDRGLQLYTARPDKEWSLTDCISFVVMQENGLTEALTADHHFEQAGFVALLK